MSSHWLVIPLLSLVKVQASCLCDSFCTCQFIATFSSSFNQYPLEAFPSLSQGMAPSGRTTRTTTTRRRRTKQPRRTNFKKQQKQKHINSKKQEIPTVLASNCSSISSQDSSKEVDIDVPEVIDVSNNSACSTPKGQKFKIPEISTCPPAPKKQRVLSNCSLRRSPLSFFAPPDLELFFYVALRDVSV